MEKSDEQLRRRFLLETEQAIREANKKIIHERIPKLTKAHVLPFATSVARLRGRYLEAAFQFSSMDISAPVSEQSIAELRQLRELYEEARLAFESLTRAIEQGYVDLEDE